MLRHVEIAYGTTRFFVNSPLPEQSLASFVVDDVGFLRIYCERDCPSRICLESETLKLKSHLATD